MKKSGVVKSEMGGAFGVPSMKGSTGIYDRGNAPFDKPHDLGGGGIPLKFAESGPSKGPTPTQTSGLETRAPRPGTMQNAFGKSNT